MNRSRYPTALRLALCAVGVLLAGAATGAEVYRWVDAEGKVHFSDSPPPGVQGVQKTAITSAPTDPDALENLDQQKEVRAKQEALTAEAEANQQKIADEHRAAAQQKCDDARKEYETIKDAHRIPVLDKDGKQTDLLNGGDVIAKKEELRLAMEEACKDLGR